MKIKIAFLVFLFGIPAVADECSFIRQGLQDLPASGGELRIPAGIFECESEIVVDKNYVALRGAGEHLTVLKLKKNFHAPLIVIGSLQTIRDLQGNYVTPFRVQGVEISDISLDGNREQHDTTRECGEGSCEGDSKAVRNNGLTVRGASDIRIERVTAHGMISGGLVTEKYCERLKVDHFTSYDNFFDGLAGYETENSEFTNLYLHDNRGAGLSIDLNFNDNVLRDLRIEDNADVGIFARHARGNQFIRAQIFRSGNHGIFLAQSAAAHSCPINNDFVDVLVRFSKKSGLRLNDDCGGNRILGSSNLCGNHELSVSESHAGLFGIEPSVKCGRP